jgi:hypothetical protein
MQSVLPAYQPAEIDAAHPRKIEIQEHYHDGFLLQDIKCLFGAFGRQGLVTAPFEYLLQCTENGRLVINYQHLLWIHSASPLR